MALPVVTNVSSINSQRYLNQSTAKLNKSLERLSSGLRINRAGDDAAGMAISEDMKAQIQGFKRAEMNSQDGLSLIGTAEGAINSYTDMLQRIRVLAVQAANDTNSSTNRVALNEEVQALLSEMDRVAHVTAFNGLKLLDGTFQEETLQIGANSGEIIKINCGDLRTSTIGQMAKSNIDLTDISALATAGPPPVTNLTANSILLNGYQVFIPGNLPTSVPASAVEIANSINNTSADHRVMAKVLPANVAFKAAAGTASEILSGMKINGHTIATTTFGENDLDGLAAVINAKSAATGVTAKVETVAGGTDKCVVLTSVDGRNIDITAATTGGADLEGGAATFDPITGDATITGADTLDANQIYGGGIELYSDDDFVVSGDGTIPSLVNGVYKLDVTTAIGTVSVTTFEQASRTMDVVDAALRQINMVRADLGATTNRLEYTINNLQISYENMSAANSRLRDTDYAQETSNMTQQQILQQAGVSVLAQANQSPQAVLSLLQG